MRTCVQKGGDVGRIDKLVVRSAHTKWMDTNKCHGKFLCIGPSKYPRTSSPEKKISLFPSIKIPHVRLFYPMRYVIMIF